jgi:hypothetical protein
MVTVIFHPDKRHAFFKNAATFLKDSKQKKSWMKFFLTVKSAKTE